MAGDGGGGGGGGAYLSLASPLLPFRRSPLPPGEIASPAQLKEGDDGGIRRHMPKWGKQDFFEKKYSSRFAPSYFPCGENDDRCHASRFPDKKEREK